MQIYSAESFFDVLEKIVGENSIYATPNEIYDN